MKFVTNQQDTIGFITFNIMLTYTLGSMKYYKNPFNNYREGQQHMCLFLKILKYCHNIQF